MHACFLLRINLRALLEDRPIFDVYIKQMYLLVALSNNTIIINPDQSILDFAVGRRFMDANVDM